LRADGGAAEGAMVGVAVTEGGVAGPSAWPTAGRQAMAVQVSRKAKWETLRMVGFRETVRILAIVGSLRPRRRASFGTVPHGWQP